MTLTNLDPRISPNNQMDGEIHRWFELSYNSYLILPRVMLQEMPHEWQAKLVALLDEAYEMGVVTPNMPVSMKNNRGRFIRVPQAWNNYRRGTLRAAMALMESEEDDG